MDIDTLIPQLKEYLTESVENKRVMEESYNKKDDINYEIVVHKLKSESRMLGLTGLGEMFYNHELAAKRKDWDYMHGSPHHTDTRRFCRSCLHQRTRTDFHHWK